MDPLTIGIGLAVWLAFRKQGESQFGVLTPEREEVYKNALEHLKDPMRLVELAKEFQTTGLKAQAATLRKRAEWRARSDQQREAHEEIFQRAMKSTNVQAILHVAQAFESMTATVKAAHLRQRARDLIKENQERMAKTVVEPTAKSPVNGTAKGTGPIPIDIPGNTDSVESKEASE
jgi:arginine utilization protein RocB